MKRAFLFVFFLFSILSLPSLATEILIKKGDTLTKIAAENNITLRELMELNDIIDANKLEVGDKIKLPKNSISYKIHIVKKGDSLIKIAAQYDLEIKELISLNNIKSEDVILIGQRIYLPATDYNDESSNLTNINSDPKKRNKTKKSIILQGVIENEDNNYNWKNYGPLKINWSSWKFKNESYIATSIHESGKPLFIAVKCNKGIINRTGKDGKWRNWIKPEQGFEFSIINELCNN